MTSQNRRARAKRRAKTMSLRRMGVPCTASKWGYDPLYERRKGELMPGQRQSVRKLARREAGRRNAASFLAWANFFEKLHSASSETLAAFYGTDSAA